MVSARYFDGKTASAQAVDLSVHGQDLLLRSAAFELRWPLQEVNISERLGNTPRLLTFARGGHCEVTDHAALEAMLAPLGVRSDWLEGLHHHLGSALFAAALIVVALLAAYRYVLPWGAQAIAMSLPATVLQKMGASTLEALDKLMLQPSKLDVARQQQLSAAYARLNPPATTHLPYHIEFRSSPGMGANAFALPDGKIVMLDELVALTKNDDEILAVLAHERGHIERRHAMRMVLQSSVVGLVLTWYMGDVSSLLTTVPAVVMQAQYSRDMEKEADEYAALTLKANGLSPCLLSTILDKLEYAHRGKSADAGAAENHDETTVRDYLSSHPANFERRSVLCPAGN